LPTGDQTLKIAAGSAQDGSLPLVITLNENILVRTSFRAAGIIGTRTSHFTTLLQLDFDPRQELPWLLTTTVALREPTTGKAHAFSVWLSDHTSNFASFPGE
jgi:hypothetical protein